MYVSGEFVRRANKQVREDRMLPPQRSNPADGRRDEEEEEDKTELLVKMKEITRSRLPNTMTLTPHRMKETCERIFCIKILLL